MRYWGRIVFLFLCWAGASELWACDNGPLPFRAASSFKVLTSTWAPDLEGAEIFPNPLRPSLGHHSITIGPLPNDAKTMIFTVSGELLREIHCECGRAVWDGKDSSGRDVQSGVYISLVRSGPRKRIMKIAVER